MTATAPPRTGMGMLQAAPPERLATLRLLTGGFAVGYLLLRLPYFLDVARLDPVRWDPPGILAPLDAPLGVGLAHAALLLTLGAGVAYTAGWRYRISGPVFAALLLGALTYRNAWGHLFHTDNLLALHVVIIGLAPAADRWSVDAHRRSGDPSPPDVRYGWPVRLAALVTVLTYVVTGVAKLRYGGGSWLGGDTLLHQIAFDNARKKVLGAPFSPIASAVAGHPALFRPLGPITVLVELSAPVAMLGRRWAGAWVTAAWTLHVGILALMAIGFPYPLTLVAFAPLFRCERVVEAARDRSAWHDARMSFRQTQMDLLTKSMNRIHRAVWKVSGRRLLASPFGMEAVELHTTGKKSGQRRTVILTSPIHDDSRVVVIASKGGDDRNPDWYTNLVADPNVEITMKGTTLPYRARTASPEEKAEMWPKVTAAYKGYAGYQKKTERDIPVVICERV